MLDEEAIGIGHGSSICLPMVSKESHLPCDREISKCHRTHQDQKEHGDDEFEGEADSKMEKEFRKYLHTQWVIFLANQTDDRE